MVRVYGCYSQPMSAPSAPRGPDDTCALVRHVVELVRPAIQADGGDVEVLHVEGGIVHVRFNGACTDCPSKGNTMRHGLLKAIQDRVPGIVDVVEG